MRISDWSSDVCSSDLFRLNFELSMLFHDGTIAAALAALFEHDLGHAPRVRDDRDRSLLRAKLPAALARLCAPLRSEERRVGKECVSQGRFRLAADQSNKKETANKQEHTQPTKK